MYILGQKYLSYNKPKIYKKHRFYENLPSAISKEAYQDKKSESFKEAEVEETPEITRLITQRDIAFVLAKQERKITDREISRRLEEAKVPLTAANIGRILQKYRKINDK